MNSKKAASYPGLEIIAKLAPVLEVGQYSCWACRYRKTGAVNGAR
jgi:hypothetical protein